MITITDIKDWLKDKINCDNWSAGALRDTKEKAIVVYNGKAYTNPTAIGAQSTYIGKGIRALIHWNKNIEETEIKAIEVYETIKNQKGKINNKRIIQIKTRDPEPIFLGADNSGIYEYVMDFEIILER